MDSPIIMDFPKKIFFERIASFELANKSFHQKNMISILLQGSSILYVNQKNYYFDHDDEEDSFHGKISLNTFFFV